MIRFFPIAAICVFLYSAAAQCQNFLNQTYVGYQGWFTTAKLSSNNLWHHWSSGESPSPGHVTFELYPDVREYDANDLIETNLGPLGNGSPSKLYAGDRIGVIDTHFKWMAQYGIDGAALQRFVSELHSPQQKTVRDRVAKMVRASAEKWNRGFYLTYDITSSNPETFVQQIKDDLANTIEPLVVSSTKYARVGTRPVIGIWGFGFTDRKNTPAQAMDLVSWLHQKGYFVIGGVPYWWRQGINDSKPGFLAAYMQFDMIQPWAVGRYRNPDEALDQFQKIQLTDKKFCDQNKKYYQRVIFPGFAWSNWNGGTYNMIPRSGGDFLWKQATLVKKLQSSAMIAMFDEYDEGTAIAKAAENRSMLPRGQNFLSLDADGFDMSSDFYLRLTTHITKMLKGEGYWTYTSRVPISLR